MPVKLDPSMVSGINTEALMVKLGMEDPDIERPEQAFTKPYVLLEMEQMGLEPGEVPEEVYIEARNEALEGRISMWAIPRRARELYAEWLQAKTFVEVMLEAQERADKSKSKQSADSE